MGVDEALIKNAQNTIDRLIRQLAEIDNERDTLDDNEYKELREDTVNQLEDYGKIVERLQGGDVSLIDELTATKIAIRAAISKAFKTPEVMALFAGKHTGLLREKLMMTETNYRSQKISKQEYLERKFEILMALQRLEEQLTEDEKKYLRDRLETPEFQLIEANANRAFPMSTVKKPKKLKLDDKTENVSPPWEAWWHPVKEKKFYTNTETKESIWEHPNIFSSKKPSKGAKQRANKRAKREETDKTTDELIDVEEMEVDVPPPAKRKSVEKPEIGETSSKRAKTSESVEHINMESEECISNVPVMDVPSDKIRPCVQWKSKVRPFNKIPYRACAIFDTCALIESPGVLNESVEKHILTVIPYAVLTELDGLKNKIKARAAASSVSSRLKDLQAEKNYYLHVETSGEQQIVIDGYYPDVKVKDDSILKCALRIKKEVLSISSTLNLNDRAILLVTNDTILSNKAMTHDLNIESVTSFIDIINGSLPESSSKKKNKKKDASPERMNHSNEKRVDTPMPSLKSKKAIAIESVKKSRETKEWIRNMVAGNNTKPSGVTISNKSNKCRPSIPLEDEIVPSLPKSNIPINSYNRKTSYQNKKPVNSLKPKSDRPKMPLSLSDDESSIGDEMDCT